jgi:biopolymer transport protein ExbD
MSLTLFMYLCLNQQKVIAAQSPDPNPGAVMENTTQIILEVRPRATYAINTQVVQPGQLQSELRGIYAARPDKTIIVRGTPGVRYQDVVTAIDIAKGAGAVESASTVKGGASVASRGTRRQIVIPSDNLAEHPPCVSLATSIAPHSIAPSIYCATDDPANRDMGADWRSY